MYEFFYGCVYKITNRVNNKVYIGQVYNKSIQQRFGRHCRETKSLISRAIHKYGKQNFTIDVIEWCDSKQQLDEKEQFWISFYNSTDRTLGYNLTIGGDGGNTYKCKNKSELNKIKEKISKANCGKNNGNSIQLKAKSIKTNEEYHFETLAETLQFFGIKSRTMIMKKVKHFDHTLFREEWLLAFETDTYQNYNLPNKHSRGTKVKLTDTNTNDEIVFGSRNCLYKWLGLDHRLNFTDTTIFYNQYKIELLK